MKLTPHTVESLRVEIGQIVAERQALRDGAGSYEDLEANRQRLAAAQALLSRLLIERHLAQPALA
jgi:multidrug efflux pump subunit AcrA (membrane-fusion protein)